MRITSRFAVFAATFVVASTALAVLSVPNPSLADLSGVYRNHVLGYAEGLEGSDATNVESALGVLNQDYKSFSLAIKKAAGAVGKIDKVLGDNAEYGADADFLVALIAIESGSNFGNRSNLAIADDILKNYNLAKLIEKNAKIIQTINTEDASSKISRAKTRQKRLILLAKVTKYWERLIKKYGRNNQDLG